MRTGHSRGAEELIAVKRRDGADCSGAVQRAVLRERRRAAPGQRRSHPAECAV